MRAADPPPHLDGAARSSAAQREQATQSSVLNFGLCYHPVHPLKCLRAHSGERKIASACQVKFSGFRTARHRRGITSLGIAAKQRNALFQFIKMGL
jgi:hypothetical protein